VGKFRGKQWTVVEIFMVNYDPHSLWATRYGRRKRTCTDRKTGVKYPYPHRIRPRFTPVLRSYTVRITAHGFTARTGPFSSSWVPKPETKRSEASTRRLASLRLSRGEAKRVEQATKRIEASFRCSPRENIVEFSNVNIFLLVSVFSQ
jgi:hypothetical protein